VTWAPPTPPTLADTPEPTAEEPPPPAPGQAPAPPHYEALRLSFEEIKVLRGRVEGGTRHLVAQSNRFRRKCLAPASSEQPGFAGTLSLTLSVDANGVTTKTTATLVRGSVPSTLQACIRRHLEADVEWDTNDKPAVLRIVMIVGDRLPTPP
jgi:hypothetical protein